jgi:hypothetical protein
MQEHPLEFPKYRAALNADQLTLSLWHPGLTALPLLGAVRRLNPSDVDYADLRIVEGDGRREVIATFAGDGPSSRNREAFVEWAVLVGYERAWLDDEMVDFGDRIPDLSEATVTCRGCGMAIVCAGQDFWAKVRELGHFPHGCGYCGSPLPEWSVEREPSPDGEGR